MRSSTVRVSVEDRSRPGRATYIFLRYESVCTLSASYMSLSSQILHHVFSLFLFF